MRKKIAFITAVMCLASGICSVSDFNNAEYSMPVSAVSSSATDRGLTAINTGSGMLVSWKYMTADTENAVYNLYRDDTLIYTSNKNDATCYIDKDGNASSKYRVDTVVDGNVKYSDNCSMISDTDYFQINLDVPKAQTSGVTYSPNDCSVGDADGDGVNEIFIKWDPSNSKDNSQKGKTDKVFIDCYKLNGTKLWRIDLGINIRAGAHYTQMLVADFDNDGYAELTCKTSDGTVDGTGQVIGDANADYRNSDGYILTGNEYYTLFDGRTGKALDTVNYNPSRGTVSKWGDKYGNRVDRFLGAVMYLDSDHPSAVTVRGYYTRMTACAYDVVDKKLVQRWYFDTGNDSSAAGYGDGNHNCMPADVDGDGKQELVLGGTCIDDNGKVLWNTNKGHGDAIHVGDLLPDRDGLEVWICHEDKPYGVSLLDAKTGKIIFHKDGASDTGRCCADNVWTGNDGAEFWGLGNDVFDGAGNTLSMKRPAINYLCYWDGDLEREILDGYTDSPAKVSKVEQNGSISTLKTTDGYYTCNTTKGTPCLSGDILGDWREEIVVRAADSKSIRIYCTPYETKYRINTLMENRQYYTQVLGENIGYNQPPHLSYYLGSDRDIPSGTGTVTPPSSNKTAVLPEGAVFMIKNVNSGLYMQVAENSASNGANVQQSNADGAVSGNMWRAVSAGDGYYYLYSQVDSNNTYCLDVTAKKTDNGTNMEIYTAKQNDAQKFRFIENEDGSYKILTKISGDKSCVEVISASTDAGANIQQWEVNGANCQDWILEQVADPGCIMDTSKIYAFKNAENGIYMDVAGGVQEAGTNVQLWGATSFGAYNTWTLEDAGNGYYYIKSMLGDGATYYLDITGAKPSSGTNTAIWTNTKTKAQHFKFRLNSDGSYKIMTKASDDKCCLSASGSGNGANVQQETMSDSAVQNWILEITGEISYQIPATTTTEETTVTEIPATTTTEKITVTEIPAATTTEKITVSEIPATTTTEKITVTEIPATTTAVSTAETTKATTKPTDDVNSKLLGDVNYDSKVDVLDVTMLKQSVVKLVELNDLQKSNADVISDGVIDVKDLGQLIKYIIKVIDKF